jgi:hypothetical protein
MIWVGGDKIFPNFPQIWGCTLSVLPPMLVSFDGMLSFQGTLFETLD